jgi:hypothetical protein
MSQVKPEGGSRVMAYKKKPKTMFSILEWRMCSKCVIGRCTECYQRVRVEGLGRGNNAYKPCECKECHHD